MRKVILDTQDVETCKLCDLSDDHPIFVKKDGEIAGMLTRKSPQGWAVNTGGGKTVAGRYYISRREALKRVMELGYVPYVN